MQRPPCTTTTSIHIRPSKQPAMPLSSSPTLALALLALVTLTGVLPLASSSRGHGVAATTNGVPPLEKHELLMLERFHGWMAEHGRSYATAEEKLRRFEIYRRNVEFIEAANRDGRLTYTLGENAFTDLTHEEFLATHTNRAPRPEEEDEEPEEETVITTRAGHVSEGPYLPAVDKVPDRVNWTAEGKVTEVKNQEQCGSCWAFAAVAVIESAYAIAKRVQPPELSEQELIDCDSYDSGCSSGLPWSAMKWVKKHGGIALDSQYPYKERKDACQEKKRLPHDVSVRDFEFVKKSEEALMTAVARRPVAVGFDSHDDCFQHYTHGVYNSMCIKNGELVGPACSGDKLNHDMAIVGYVGKGNDKGKYWIAKNSWGKGWGQQGYVWLKKDVADPEGLCGIVATRPSYPIV
ncbi:senescence-specific cysteine protease SAG39 [Setaria viridis]|uniref:Cathepsin propeptide inhibitor domain-containing protein n=1 Tax=Setaria viridis TaxID=4556 RepID=A0A4U6WGT0_SETVI|nr:hypothetical protein SEVIR_1G030600v2 [Setaria viridis]